MLWSTAKEIALGIGPEHVDWDWDCDCYWDWGLWRVVESGELVRLFFLSGHARKIPRQTVPLRSLCDPMLSQSFEFPSINLSNPMPCDRTKAESVVGDERTTYVPFFAICSTGMRRYSLGSSTVQHCPWQALIQYTS